MNVETQCINASSRSFDMKVTRELAGAMGIVSARARELAGNRIDKRRLGIRAISGLILIVYAA